MRPPAKGRTPSNPFDKPDPHRGGSTQSHPGAGTSTHHPTGETETMIHLFVIAAIGLALSFIDGADRDALICAAVLVPLFVAVAVLA